VRLKLPVIACLGMFVAVAAGWYFVHWHRAKGDAAVTQSPSSARPTTVSAEGSQQDFVKLPETSPPPGLPIIPWGPRDLFPIIRKPSFVSAKEGKNLLAADEPVLGIALGGEARAYSTNHLNKHEMVIDEIAGTPILVTY